MKVDQIMSLTPITVEPRTAIIDAQVMMRRESIRRMPVLDWDKKLVGIVSEKDLLFATPSPAAPLSLYELSGLLSRIMVQRVMTKQVVTVTPDTLIGEAARLMVDRGIGGLPVLDADRVVGIVTESDIFKLFIDHYGARRPGIRVTALVADMPGKIVGITAAVIEAGGIIISFGTISGEDPATAICTVKVDKISEERLTDLIEPHVIKVMDIRSA